MLENIEKFTQSMRDTYIYIKDIAKYYWVEKRKFFRAPDVCSNLMIDGKQLKSMRSSGIIKDFDSLCYYRGGKEHCYNLLSEEDILPSSDNPILDPYIDELITSIAGNKDENIEYLYKAILYKYHNLNDYTIPAIVFYGIGGSGKSSFITLLSSIFGEKNVMGNLGQRDIASSFDTYKGQKLIVEYAEISTNSTNSDMMVLNKLKNIIGAEKLTVNEKGIQPYQIENIAWFFISSNSNKPLQLDDKDKGNRRFCVMKSIEKLKNGKEVNESIRNKEKVSNFLAWLHGMFPDVLEYKNLEALENDDKRELEERSQNEVNQFWDWLIESYPEYTGKVRVSTLYDKMFEYCTDNGINEKSFKKYFWHSSKYTKKKMRFGNKIYAGVNIE